jgi:hypothetical protein
MFSVQRNGLENDFGCDKRIAIAVAADPTGKAQERPHAFHSVE